MVFHFIVTVAILIIIITAAIVTFMKEAYFGNSMSIISGLWHVWSGLCLMNTVYVWSG
jgi:hypothetical protein